MAKNKDENNKFPFWFKIEKNKIKLQLKDLGDKFLMKRTRKKGLTILILLFLLIVVGIALNNGYFTDKISEEGEVSIEPIVSREDNLIVDKSNKEEELKLNIKGLNLKDNSGAIDSSLERTESTGEKSVEEVLTEPVRPMIKTIDTKIELLKPVAGEILQRPGWYYHPVFADWRYQQGIDLKGNSGDIVMAAAQGRVISVKEDKYKGIMVTIEHKNGWQTLYGHLQKTTVSPEEVVGKGQEVGRVGTTGISSQPELYFELLNEDGPIDPTEYFE